jgi:hypothetical protein
VGLCVCGGGGGFADTRKGACAEDADTTGIFVQVLVNVECHLPLCASHDCSYGTPGALVASAGLPAVL